MIVTSGAYGVPVMYTTNASILWSDLDNKKVKLNRMLSVAGICIVTHVIYAVTYENLK